VFPLHHIEVSPSINLKLTSREIIFGVFQAYVQRLRTEPLRLLDHARLRLEQFTYSSSLTARARHFSLQEIPQDLFI